MASTSYNPTAKADGGGEATSEAPAPMPHKESDELYRGLKKAKKDRGSTAKERISKMPPCTAGKRSSIYRGVTRHRWTGRYEAHLWDKSTWNQNQNKKGKQVYLGAYDDEEAAARAYDLAALRYWGPGTLINFPVTDYKRDLEEMQNMSREEYLALLRRKSSGFSRGTSKYRPLTSSRWDPYFGRASGTDYNKSISYGDNNATAEKDYIGSLCVDRKIDLTNYIKWWGTTTTTTTTTTTNKQQGQVDSHKKSLHDEDLGSESKAMTLSNYPTEPYEMPRLGMSTVEGKKQKGGSSTSALSILLRSAAYKRLQEKGLKRKAIEENDDNENRNAVNDRMDRGKGVVEKSSHQVQMKDLDLGMMEDYSFKQMLFFHPFPPSSFDGAF